MKTIQFACVALLACGSHAPQSTDGPPATGARLEVVASGLKSPVHLSAPAGDARLFVVEQQGTIRIVKGGQVLAVPFLDIRSKVKSGGEQGLLSVAFHPQFATNGFFYVDYTDIDGDTRVERYQVSRDPDLADVSTARLVIGIDQPYANHNGGLLVFGPDQMLYIGMGDGGSGGDPQGNGQNRATLLGALLRIDVDGGDPYAVPADNPYVNQPPFRGEIWAWGLRNPWRYAFDRTAGLLYIADVGQNDWEEVNVVPATQKGVNYGWNIMEGTHCYHSSDCNSAGLTKPVLEYGHGDGCSITGGFVYRGKNVPQIQGHYFYADYCNGWIKSFKYVNGAVTEKQNWNLGDIGNITSFGEDGAGELYVVSSNGKIYKFVSS